MRFLDYIFGGARDNKIYRQLKNLIKLYTALVLRLVLGISFSSKKSDFDYAYYLGPEWLNELKQNVKPVPTFVANHIMVNDWLMTLDRWDLTGFAIIQRSIKLIFFGTTVRLVLDNIWIPASHRELEAKKKALNDIIVKQKQFAESANNGIVKRVLIYPEGIVSNASFLYDFKIGAFNFLKPVIPIANVLEEQRVMGTFNAFSELVCIILIASQPYIHIDTCDLPTFIPNDYLFTMHADKGKDKAHIYAWAIRDIMSRKTGMSKCNGVGQQTKKEYRAALDLTKNSNDMGSFYSKQKISQELV